MYNEKQFDEKIEELERLIKSGAGIGLTYHNMDLYDQVLESKARQPKPQYSEEFYEQLAIMLNPADMDRIISIQKYRMTGIEKNVNRLEEILKEMDSGE